MSLITRCPACQTLFKVVPDQLRISEGWVRCGQCDEVFDAALQLVQSLAPVNVAAVPQDVLALQENAPPSQEVFMTSTSEAETVMVGAILADELPAVESPVGSVSEGPPPLSLSEPHEETPEQAECVEPFVSVQTPPVSRESSHDPECKSYPDSNEISFLHQVNVPSAKPSLLMRATWAFLSAALILGLAGQIALYERDHIAALRPDLRPWLQAICDRLNCRISPWRKIESIVIDSSAFTRIHDDSYQLSLTLKNMVAVPVALPALELTLTDTLDQPVIRRVLILSASDNKSDIIAAGLELPVSLTMVLNPAGGADRVVGYRLLAFYP